MAFKPAPKQSVKAAPKKKAVPSGAKKARQEDIRSIEEELEYRKGLVSIKDLIAPAAFEIQASYVRLGSKFARTLFVVGYPRFINVGWFAPIINYSASFDVAIFFAPLSIPVVLKQLRNKVGRTEAEISMNEEKGKPRDPVAETALRDMEKLRDDLTQGIEHFFSVGLYVTLYGDTLQELDKLTEDMEGIFGTKLVNTKRVFYQAEQGFTSTLPLAQDALSIFFNMNTAPAAAAFPFISSDLTSDNGILYGINRHNNSLILFDRFSMQNANEVVFATSGAGKSLERNIPIIIKDSEGIKMVKIGEYIDALAATRRFETIDEEMEGVVFPGVQVYTFNKELKGEWSEVSVAARKDAPEDEYVFRLASGREITVTGDHNMLVVRKGRIATFKSEEIGVGECIPLPKAISQPSEAVMHIDCARKLADNQYCIIQNDRITPKNNWKKYSIPLEIPVTKSLMRIFGYIVSEGCIGANYIKISQEDQETKSDISACLLSVGIPFYCPKNRGEFIIHARVWVELFKSLGLIGKSHEKRVPGIVYSVSNEMAAEFLRAYFEGDGGCENHAVSATSKSKELISDLSYLLLRFGIVTRLCERKKRATNSGAEGTYSMLTISGQEFIAVFRDQINFVSQRKRDGLERLLNKKGNTNVWTIPVQDVFAELYQIFESQFRGIQDVIELKNGSFQPSREKLAAVIDQLERAVERFIAFRGEIELLRRLPYLSNVIVMGSASRELNGELWSELGQSWRLMKNGDVDPRSKNVFRAASVVYGETVEFERVKSAVHRGFKVLNLSINEFDRSFGDGLRYAHDLDYQRLFAAARSLIYEYTRLEKQLSRVNELIGRLRALANADLVFDPIVSIEKRKTTDRYVYDLTVDNEVFLAGHGGLYVHNSYTIKLEVLRSMMMGVDVIIIDPEREYQHLCDAVGGTYINISLSSQSRINPFDLPRAVGEQANAADIIRSAVITLKGLLRIMLGQVTTVEDSLLDRALIETYAKKDITPACDLSQVEAPTMTDLVEVLDGMEGAGQLVEKLKKYTEGTFAGLINHRTNVEMRNQLVVFSVRDLEDELRPIAIYTVVNYIWNVVRSEMKKRILVIDEAWWLMQHEDSARFIFALVKRCRKYYLGVTTITQDVNDFLNSEHGRAILTNSAIQILLKQSTAAIDTIQKTFLLTEGEKYLLLEGGPGEGIFFAGQKHVAIKVVASYTEDQLITTDPRQLLEIQTAKDEFAAENAE